MRQSFFLILFTLSSIISAKTNIGHNDRPAKWMLGKTPTNHTIGISDPELNDEVAFSQALSRALFLYILEKGVIVWSESEIYSKDIENDYVSSKDKNTTHIMLINADDVFNNSKITYNIIDSYKSISNELILYVEFQTEYCNSSPEVKISLESSVNYYNTFREEVKRKSELIILGDSGIIGDTQGQMYIMESKNACLEIESLSGKYNKKRRYILEPATIGPDNCMYYNVESLWDTLFLSLIDQLINIQFNKTKFKSIKDEFIINNMLLKNNLQTYKGLDSFSFKPSIKEYKNKRILIVWNIVSQNK